MYTVKTSSTAEKKAVPYTVTGTFHGSIVFAISEGEARRIFHKRYNGESILSVKLSNGFFLS